MLQSIFTNNNCEKPDFVLKGKSGSTSIFLDKATKLDIILSTVYNINDPVSESEQRQEPNKENIPEGRELTAEER